MFYIWYHTLIKVAWLNYVQWLLKAIFKLFSFWFTTFKCDFNKMFDLLTHKQLEMHGCVFSNVATDARVLKHQAISTHSTHKIFTVLNLFHTEILHLWWILWENKTTFWKKIGLNHPKQCHSSYLTNADYIYDINFYSDSWPMGNILFSSAIEINISCLHIITVVYSLCMWHPPII